MRKRSNSTSSLQVDDLASLEFFRAFEPGQIGELLPYLESFSYAPDRSPILEEDLSNKGIQVILEGEVRVVKHVSEDSGIKLATLRRGDIFGEASMFDKGPHTSRVEASEPTRTVSISRASYERLREEKPHLAEKIAAEAAAILSDRLRQANQAVFAYAIWSKSLQKNPPPTYWTWHPLTTDSTLILHDLDARTEREKPAGWRFWKKRRKKDKRGKK